MSDSLNNRAICCPKCSYLYPNCGICRSRSKIQIFGVCIDCWRNCRSCCFFLANHLKKLTVFSLALKKKNFMVPKDILKYIFELAKPHIVHCLTYPPFRAHLTDDTELYQAYRNKGFVFRDMCIRELSICIAQKDHRYQKSPGCYGLARVCDQDMCFHCTPRNRCAQCERPKCVNNKLYIERGVCNICFQLIPCPVEGCNGYVLKSKWTSGASVCNTCTIKVSKCDVCPKIYAKHSWMWKWYNSVSACASCVTGKNCIPAAVVAYFRSVRSAMVTYLTRHVHMTGSSTIEYIGGVITSLVFRLSVCHDRLSDYQRALRYGIKGRTREEILEYLGTYQEYEWVDWIWPVVMLPDSVIMKIIKYTYY